MQTATLPVLPISATLSEVPVERLARHLASSGMHLDIPSGAQRMSGGLANRNYIVQVDGRHCVLRRPPDGDLPPGAHDMAREHRVLSRLWRRFPLAPPSLHLCTDPAVIGAPFQLIEYRVGLVIRGDKLPSGSAPDVGERLSGAMLETLAALHSLDSADVDLANLGRPDGFAFRAVEGWAGRAWRAVTTATLRQLTGEIAAWLKARQPHPQAAVLLHCDFKLDNLILDPGSLAPIALVDWDMCTRGDPLFDLATLLSYWAEPGDPDCMGTLAQMPTARPGFPKRDDIVARYAALTGRDVSNYPFFRVLAMFKLGVVFLQLHERWRTGAVTEDRYAGFAALGTDLLIFARDIALGRAR